MARIRNKTDEELVLRLAEVTRAVKPDESVDIDDDVFSRYEWPESTWDVVASAKSAPATTPTPSTAPEVPVDAKEKS